VNDLERCQELQRLLVEAGFDTTLNARRERDEAVFSLVVELHGEQAPEVMAKLVGITTPHGFGFTIDGDTVQIVML
jgi:hypothetical protein